jgi:beta-lactamase regulating signal transducer with metallopeptidase domain
MILASATPALSRLASFLLVGGVAGVVIKTTAVLLATAAVAIVARRASAALRHVVWLVGLTGALAVTVLSMGGPSIPVRVPQARVVPVPRPARAFPIARPVAVPTHRRVFARNRVVPVLAFRPHRIGIRDRGLGFDGRIVVAIAWLVGVILVLARAALGHLALARVVSLSRPIGTPDWQLALFHAGHEAGLSRPVRLLESETVQSPITSGWLNPVVILPTDADSWDAERRRVVLVHELAHVARGDYASQLLATIACAIFWFNPLVWIAAARLRIEAEHAADDIVLAGGTTGVTYASHLLDLARHERALHLAAAVAVGMIRSTRLEGRFRAVLDSTRPRARVSPALLAIAAVMTLIVFIPLGGLRAKAYGMSWQRRALPVRPAIFAEEAVPMVVVVPAAPQVEAIPAIEAVPAVAAVAAVEAVPIEPPAVAAVPAIAVIQSRADSTFEKSIDAASGDRLRLDLRTGGNIVLHGWNESRVRLRAQLGGRDWRETRVTLDRVGREVRLRSDFDRVLDGTSTSTSHSFELWVPRSIDVDIASSGGSISLDNVNGEFSGHTGGGEITIVSASGSATLTTGGGEIRVSNSDLRGEVSTGGGGVTITNVTGGLRGSSGSGPVITTLPSGTTIGGAREAVAAAAVTGGVADVVRGRATTTTTTITGSGQSRITNRGVTTTSYQDDRSPFATTRGFLDGAVSMTKAGGEVTLSEMNRGGVVHTGGGRISIGESRGLLDVSTGGGDIELMKMGGDAVVSTGAGDVTIQVVNVDGTEHSISVYSGKGSVVLELPSNLNARLELEAAYTDNSSRRTRIESDFPVAPSESQEWDDRFGTPRKFVRGTATLGGGRGLIRVRTVNGDIVVRRR